MSCWQNNFSHLYLERGARDYPWTERIRRRFPKAKQIWIEDYKDFFGRPRQNFPRQKESMKLIVATKKYDFLYPGSSHAQDFGYTNFYYNSLILNCLYHCDYCYLQGMYPSANIVLFVNLEDYFKATSEAVARRAEPASPLYLAISYDTDLLAFESILPYCREWIEFSRREKALLIEIRTKSASYQAIRDMVPHARVVLAWTLSPEIIVKTYEKRTPALAHRLEAAAAALADGWAVRLCFDPVLKIPQWREAYRQCLETTFARLPPEKIRDVSVGVFRMNADFFKRMQKFRDDTDLLHYPYERHGKTITYGKTEGEELTGFMSEFLKQYFPPKKIELWT